MGLQEALQSGVVTVTFTKVNGETRVMRCTKNMSLVPQEFHNTESDKPRKINEAVMSVFDLDKNGWRSFRKDLVIEYAEAE